ncbi:flavodoxin domain-containing protein [Georgenia sp. AZ-5]|uniref:flavodoxin domain-containing protein n=1 Tax=Georgenia sp. AZ-5 TaxID=3367526 RepID=UPI0037549C4C
MKVLVTAASRHGGTAEIAAAVARDLAAAGHDVEVRDPAEVTELAEVDAVVLGSAVYAGGWLPAAYDFVQRLGPELAARDVWLFSSGPPGYAPWLNQEIAIDEVVRTVRPREHRVFDGRVDKHRLTYAERARVHALRVPIGDFRDFGAVAEWARKISAELGAAPRATTANSG